MKCREKVERRQTTASVGIAYSVLCAGRVPGVWAGDLAGCDDAARPPGSRGCVSGRICDGAGDVADRQRRFHGRTAGARERRGGEICAERVRGGERGSVVRRR